jgi:hypothetical protein
MKKAEVKKPAVFIKTQRINIKPKSSITALKIASRPVYWNCGLSDGICA